MSERHQSVVKWFDNAKGYGFIVNPDPNEPDMDLFVHYRSIEAEGYKTLTEGEPVSYLKIRTDGRYTAVEVQSLKRTATVKSKKKQESPA